MNDLHIPFQALVDNHNCLDVGLNRVDRGREYAVSSSPRLLGSFLADYPHLLYEPSAEATESTDTASEGGEADDEEERRHATTDSSGGARTWGGCAVASSPTRTRRATS